MRVAINGFGRIGRTVFRILDKRGDVDVVAINDLFNNEALRYLLHYDTVMGPFDGTLRLEGDDLVTSHGRTRMLCERDPLKLPWNDLGIDVVVESTGIFTAKEQLAHHLRAGAKRVVLTVPAKDEIDYTVVLGVNDDGLNPQHRIISNASCTTNCLAPLAKVLHDSFGIVEGIINTVHAYTNDQRLADVPHADWRRSRAAAENIIPTSTGAAKAVGMVLPQLKGRLDGISLRVPTPNVSCVDLAALLEKKATGDEVNAAFKAAADGPLKGILEYVVEPLVSIDFRANPHSSIIDAPYTKVMDGDFVKVLAWYDNEWAYSNRCVDLLQLLVKKGI